MYSHVANGPIAAKTCCKDNARMPCVRRAAVKGEQCFDGNIIP